MMSRPPVPRRVCCRPDARGFRPVGVPACKTDALTIGVDELEAIRLADLEGLYQDASAERMGVSRPTYARILARGREAMARALVERRMLLVGHGPVVEEAQPAGQCPVHGGPRRQGRTCHCPGRHDQMDVRCRCASCLSDGARGHRPFANATESQGRKDTRKDQGVSDAALRSSSGGSRSR
jgi:predicted DNA-binding protein (UPF0251 family)